MSSSRELFAKYQQKYSSLQGDEHLDQNIKVDQVLNDDMDRDNISDTNQEDEICRLIQDTFAPMDEAGNQNDSHDVDPLLEKACQPLHEG